MADIREQFYCARCFARLDLLSNPEEVSCTTCGQAIEHEEQMLTEEQYAVKVFAAEADLTIAKKDGLIKS